MSDDYLTLNRADRDSRAHAESPDHDVERAIADLRPGARRTPLGFDITATRKDTL